MAMWAKHCLKGGRRNDVAKQDGVSYHSKYDCSHFPIVEVIELWCGIQRSSFPNGALGRISTQHVVLNGDDERPTFSSSPLTIITKTVEAPMRTKTDIRTRPWYCTFRIVDYFDPCSTKQKINRWPSLKLEVLRNRSRFFRR